MTNEQCEAYVKTPYFDERWQAAKAKLIADEQGKPIAPDTDLNSYAAGFAEGLTRAFMLLAKDENDDALWSELIDPKR